MPLAATKHKPRLASALRDSRPAAEPLWEGPCGIGPQGGVTASLLAKSFVCAERFRIHTVEGLRPAEQFSRRLEYGNMHHVCEEVLAKWNVQENKSVDTQAKIFDALKTYCRQLCRKFPLQQSEIVRWHNVCRAQFPLYVEWWAQHPDVRDRTPLLQEQVFDVPCPLPSGRVVRLRGKWDSVDLVGKGRNAGIWLQENKSKGDIDEPQLRRQLSSGFDLQTMLYLVALYNCNKATSDGWFYYDVELAPSKIQGVRYNVIRRPLSGGRGSISQREATQGSKCNLKSCRKRPDPACEKCGGTGRVGAKPAETDAEFSARLADVIRSAHGPEWEMPQGEHYFFMRWNVVVTPADVARFRRECLDPALENLCDSYEHWSWCLETKTNQYDEGARRKKFPEHRPRHFVVPYGLYDPLKQGGVTDIDSYLQTKSAIGLVRATDLFPELR